MLQVKINIYYLERIDPADAKKKEDLRVNTRPRVQYIYTCRNSMYFQHIWLKTKMYKKRRELKYFLNIQDEDHVKQISFECKVDLYFIPCSLIGFLWFNVV